MVENIKERAIGDILIRMLVEREGLLEHILHPK